MQILIEHNAVKTNIGKGCLVFFVLLLTAIPVLCGDAKLTNLIVRNNHNELQVDLLIKGIFTEEMKTDMSKGIPVNLTFLILLYEVRDYWFDDKMISKTAMHDVKFDVLKKDYRIQPSLEKGGPVVEKDFLKAQNYLFELH